MKIVYRAGSDRDRANKAFVFTKARNRGFVDNGRRIDKFQKKDDRAGYCRTAKNSSRK